MILIHNYDILEECAPIDYDLGERNILFPSEQALGIPIQKSQPLFLRNFPIFPIYSLFCLLKIRNMLGILLLSRGPISSSKL